MYARNYRGINFIIMDIDSMSDIYIYVYILNIKCRIIKWEYLHHRSI